MALAQQHRACQPGVVQNKAGTFSPRRNYRYIKRRVLSSVQQDLGRMSLWHILTATFGFVVGE